MIFVFALFTLITGKLFFETSKAMIQYNNRDKYIKLWWISLILFATSGGLLTESIISFNCSCNQIQTTKETK